MTWSFTAAELARALRDPRARDGNDRGYVFVAGRHTYSAKHVSLIAERLHRGKAVDPEEVTGGLNVARYVQQIAPTVRVAVRVKLACVIMASRWKASELKTLAASIGDRGEWVANQQGILETVFDNDDAYLERFRCIVRDASVREADLVMFPTCALAYREHANKKRIESLIASLPLAAIGRLPLPAKRRRLMSELPREDAVLLKGGSVVASVAFRAEPTAACIVDGRFGVGLTISQQIHTFWKEPDAVVDAALRSKRVPWLLADLGHQQYPMRHVALTLPACCRGWRDSGAGGRPVAALAYWHHADSKASASNVIDTDRVRTKRSSRVPVPKAGPGPSDWIDTYDLLLDVPGT